MVLDVLVFDGRIKLACTALLAHHLFTSSLSPGYSFNGAHHLSMWPAILLDCFLHPDAAALMTGPLIKSYRGGLPPGYSVTRRFLNFLCGLPHTAVLLFTLLTTKAAALHSIANHCKYLC